MMNQKYTKKSKKDKDKNVTFFLRFPKQLVFLLFFNYDLISWTSD